ncbi:N-acetyl-gamma-glutamyl-phosphate reductase [Marispirochaeta aestuarii]|uniref:N-acetyl-gamma-glutamyl-phosphate reductase n=1 Tax=Marispirochaeta aestuarii TaxID=1963862 RepID=UPI0029C8BC85|nr:N-acetyl-gamma-glutamyl-phosphate reductase [Marispirochaeta aestuarii]
MKAAILGSTGYTGMLLTRLLAGHPGVEKILPVSSSKAGTAIQAVDNGFAETDKLVSSEYLSLEEMSAHKPDVVFAGLPHLASARVCAPFIGKSLVIDLSADFRLADRQLFASAYGAPAPEAAVPPVYGLCEIYEETIKRADLIANPGCYPTATLLPLLPVLKGNLAEGPVIVNAISGISGAGKKSQENYLFCERSENAGAYSPGRSHRHWAEMTDQLRVNRLGGELYFTPHLAPLRRGMAVTTTLTIKPGVTENAIRKAYDEAYAGKPFIRLLEGRLPQTREVWGSNRCDIAFRLQEDRLYLFSCIDNLVKGASGQAVQNMNIRLGFDGTTGLALSGMV